ncbi:MAG: AMP-binding protein [Pseudomonadota bacterium]|nr:AMP-binding protein [Pseudomonadota bacterium]
MNILPLLRHERREMPVAYRAGQPISAAQFLHDVNTLAAQLPDREYVINLCGDRYRFAVGLAAALVRRQISLLPPNHTPAIVAALRCDYPGLYGLTDSPLAELDLERFPFPSLQTMAGNGYKVPAIPAEQVVAHVFTSGSTGRPTSHCKTWGSFAFGARAQAERFSLATGSGATLVGTVPPQHMYGLESSLILALQNGLSFVAGHPFYPEDIRVALAELPVARVLITTPFHLRALVDTDQPLPQLSCLISATAPLPLDLAVLAESRFNVPLYEIYGCTEAGQVATRRTVVSPIWQTYRDVRVYRRGENVYACGGAVEQEAQLLDVIEPIDDEHFTLHGRTADLINIAGKRTSLANLNYHLNTIDGVTDGVFYMPAHQDQGVTRLSALVVAPRLAAGQVLAALRSRIDAAFIPRPIYFVDSLPRNSTGKLPQQAVANLVLRLRDQDKARAIFLPSTDQVDIVIARNHPSTSGHFPGNPIVPGALLLAEVLAAWEGLLGASVKSSVIKVAKFLSPTRPGDSVSIHFERVSIDGVKFNCVVKETTVLSGSFSYSMI